MINAQLTQSDELPDAFETNEEKTWITQHNHPEVRKIALYEGVEPLDLRLYGPAGKMLKKLFYNIQQTSYYCDFTLESG